MPKESAIFAVSKSKLPGRRTPTNADTINSYNDSKHRTCLSFLCSSKPSHYYLSSYHNIHIKDKQEHVFIYLFIYLYIFFLLFFSSLYWSLLAKIRKSSPQHGPESPRQHTIMPWQDRSHAHQTKTIKRMQKDRSIGQKNIRKMSTTSNSNTTQPISGSTKKSKQSTHITNQSHTNLNDSLSPSPNHPPLLPARWLPCPSGPTTKDNVQSICPIWIDETKPLGVALNKHVYYVISTTNMALQRQGPKPWKSVKQKTDENTLVTCTPSDSRNAFRRQVSQTFQLNCDSRRTFRHRFSLYFPYGIYWHKHMQTRKGGNYKTIYSRLSLSPLSRIQRDSLKYFETSVPRHIRSAELRKK